MSEKISTTKSQAFDIAENKVLKLLATRKFQIKYCKGKQKKLWDITAKKGNDNWIIAVETGTNFRTKIDSIQKILYQKVSKKGGYNKFGLAFVSKRKVYFFEYRKLV